MENRAVTYIQCPVFHVGKEEDIQRFCHDENLIIYHEESGNWLGNGMYFWDNVYDATYWFNNLKRKNPGKEYACSRGNLKVKEEKFLNLTNRHNVKEFEQELEHLCGMTHHNMKDSPGANINLYYKLYKEFFGEKPFTVSKIFGQYKKIPVDDLIFKSSNETANVVMNIRTVYSVIEASNVCDRREISIEEDIK